MAHNKILRLLAASPIGPRFLDIVNHSLSGHDHPGDSGQEHSGAFCRRPLHFSSRHGGAWPRPHDDGQLQVQPLLVGNHAHATGFLAKM